MRGFPPDDLFPRRHAASSGRTHASTVLAVRLQGDLRRLLVAGVRVERGHVEVLANARLDDVDAFARRRLSRRDRPGWRFRYAMMARAEGSGIGAPNVPIILLTSASHVALVSGGCIVMYVVL